MPRLQASGRCREAKAYRCSMALILGKWRSKRVQQINFTSIPNTLSTFSNFLASFKLTGFVQRAFTLLLKASCLFRSLLDLISAKMVEAHVGDIASHTSISLVLLQSRPLQACWCLWRWSRMVLQNQARLLLCYYMFHLAGLKLKEDTNWSSCHRRKEYDACRNGIRHF